MQMAIPLGTGMHKTTTHMSIHGSVCSFTDDIPKELVSSIPNKLTEWLDGRMTSKDTGSQQAAIGVLKDTLTAILAPEAFHLFLAGSFRLNVHSTGSDVDIVIMVRASVIGRGPLFAALQSALASMSHVTSVYSILDARVPLLCATIHGCDVDVMSCHVTTHELPSRDAALWSYDAMNGADGPSILSFNGPRVTEVLLHAFGFQGSPFQPATRLLRAWAVARGIYGNREGFLGGVNIALLVAWAMQQWTIRRKTPGVPPADALVHFLFQSLCAWEPRGNQKSPDALTTLAIQPLSPHACPVWLLQYHTDGSIGRDHMVLLTPCFPRFNSTHSMSVHTGRHVRSEIQRAAVICRANNETLYDDLVAPVTQELITTAHRFIAVRAIEGGQAPPLPWVGKLQATLRVLVSVLDTADLDAHGLRAIPGWHAHGSDLVTLLACRRPTTKRKRHKDTLASSLAYFLTVQDLGDASVTISYIDPLSVCAITGWATPDAPRPLFQTMPPPKRPPMPFPRPPPIPPPPPPSPPSRPHARLRIVDRHQPTLPPMVTASRVRIVRKHGVIVTPFDVYTGPPVLLRGTRHVLWPSVHGLVCGGPIVALSEASLIACKDARIACWCVDTRACVASALVWCVHHALTLPTQQIIDKSPQRWTRRSYTTTCP